jgi:NAD(P)-dependent dehydrogenase (short-subunit alcohol dehydrogenase family)
MGWFDGQVALVTGGGSGIGRAVVARFIEEGGRVGVMERVVARAEQLRDEFGDKVIGSAGDVAQLADNKRAVAETVRAFGRLDVFVGNAGIFDVYASVADLPEEQLSRAYDELFGVNVKGLIFGARAALPELRKNRGFDGVYRVGCRPKLGWRRCPLHRLETCRGRLDPRVGGGVGARDPGQRRRARRHDDRSARAHLARQ